MLYIATEAGSCQHNPGKLQSVRLFDKRGKVAITHTHRDTKPKKDHTFGTKPQLI